MMTGQPYGGPPGHLIGQPHAVAAMVGLAGAPGDLGSNRDFALEKPEAYRAFEQMAVQMSADGTTTICLANQMCQDRHIPDFLQCLRCWLPRKLGQPSSTGHPWRLHCLDISKNGLADASIASVMDTLIQLDVRVEQLRLAGNGAEARGLSAVMEYVWNCQEPIRELDIADNNIVADPMAGPEHGNDCVSALLRCFYNHPSYPCARDRAGRSPEVFPLLLRLGGNFISHPKKLLKDIQSKGGKDKVQIAADSAPYSQAHQEFLSVCLPDFLEQRKADKASTPPPRKSRSRDRRRRRDVTPAGTAPIVRGEQRVERTRVELKPAAGAARKHSKSGKSSKKKDGSPAASASLADGSSRSDSPATKPATASKKHRRHRDGAAEATSRSADVPTLQNGASQTPAQGVPDQGREGATLPVMSPEQQKVLQDLVGVKLKEMKVEETANAGEPSTREMLAEFVVCMVVARKGDEDLNDELGAFLGPKEATELVDWLHKKARQLAASDGAANPEPQASVPVKRRRSSDDEKRPR